jgi:hypothetical protein
LVGAEPVDPDEGLADMEVAVNGWNEKPVAGVLDDAGVDVAAEPKEKEEVALSGSAGFAPKEKPADAGGAAGVPNEKVDDDAGAGAAGAAGAALKEKLDEGAGWLGAAGVAPKPKPKPVPALDEAGAADPPVAAPKPNADGLLEAVAALDAAGLALAPPKLSCG